MAIHNIYPSSNVAPELIADYGWEFIESIPTTVNAQGRLAPTPERSELHTSLRRAIDENGIAVYRLNTGEEISLNDFAIAESHEHMNTLGFFALQ